ncbi:MAG: hypothetical protein ACTHN7_12190 [Solirubrobacterales bacterium]
MSEFFKPPPPVKIAEEPPREEWMGPPQAVIPAVVPVERIVARGEEVVVYLSGFWVFPAGFEAQVRVVVRDEESELEPFSYEYEDLAARTGEIPPGQLRIGFAFADGSKVTNTGEDFAWEWPPHLERPISPKMSSTGGRGGRNRDEGSWAEGFWVWPLPPLGELSLVCEWPAAGIPLTRFALDADVILDAVPRVQELFDG